MVIAFGAIVPIAVAVGPGAVASAAGGGIALAFGGGIAKVAAAGPVAANAVAAAAAPLIAAGPVGMVALGADGDSWDCWRTVLRDFDSKEPRGRLLKDVAADPRVVEVRSKTQEGYWPQIWLKNKWQEEFRIDYVQLPGGEIAAHAVRVQ